MPSLHSQSTYSLQQDPYFISNFQSITTSSGEDASLAFDDQEETYISHTEVGNIERWVELDIGEDKLIQLYKFSVIFGGDDQDYYDQLVGVSLQGLNTDTRTWDQLHVFEASNHYWNEWQAPTFNTDGTKIQLPLYQKYRLYHQTQNTHFYVNQIDILGIVLINDSNSSLQCELQVVFEDGTSNIQEDAVKYSDTATPTISKLNLKWGSTAGGDSLTFTGTGLEGSGVSVIIDNIQCAAAVAYSKTVTCTTGPRPEYVTPSQLIKIIGKGYAANQGHIFLYADYWSSEITWGGQAPPRDGDSVYIPPGQNIILDESTARLVLLTVEGILQIEDNGNDIKLQAYYIFVNNGKLIAGTQQDPYQSKLEIVMFGNRDTRSLPTYGNKVIAVRNSIIQIHGTPRSHTWSFLNSQVTSGETELEIAGEIDWKAGEEIVIAPTSFDSQQAEVRTISTVSAYDSQADSTTISISEPLSFDHYGEIEEYSNGVVTDSIDMRAEVGLLTRNIKIRGCNQNIEDEEPDCREALYEEHGVHIMMFSPGDQSVQARIEYVEIFHAGQAFTLGRYPLHLHRVNRVTKSYLRGNSVHDTFNRGITIHGVHYLRVQNNLAYHNKGHAIFVQDGIQTNNIIQYNLVVNTVASFSLLNTDSSPASFWITNFDNYFRGNHAAGSPNYGFWFDPPDHPTGPSKTDTVCPMHVQLGEFKDNTAHSNGRYGLRIFHGHIPVQRPCDTKRDFSIKDWWTHNPSIETVYQNFTGWKNGKNGVMSDDMGWIVFDGFKVADNKETGIEMGFTEWSEPFATTSIRNALVIGVSQYGDAAAMEGCRGIRTSQNDGMIVQNIRFHNFDNTMYTIGDGSKSSHGNTRDFGGRLHELSSLSFTNSQKLFYWENPWRGIFHVTDNTLNGKSDIYVAAHWDHLETDKCVYQKETYNAVICQPGQIIRRVLFYDQKPFSTFNWQSVYVTPTDTQNTTNQPLGMVRCKGRKSPYEKSWVVPLVTGHQYDIGWGSSQLNWEHLGIQIDSFEGDEYVILNFLIGDAREHYEVTRGTIPSEMDTQAQDFVDPTLLKDLQREVTSSDTAGQYYWGNKTITDEETGQTTENVEFFQILLNGNVQDEDINWGDIFILGYSCWGDHCNVVYQETDVDQDQYYWSQQETWDEILGRYPQDGDEIQIPNTMHLVVDVSTPQLKSLTIYGTVQLQRETSVLLQSYWIFVNGGSLLSGTQDRPLDSNVVHQIRLLGTQLSNSLSFSTDVYAGNKVLANTGDIQLHGYPKVYKTQLVLNAHPGDNFIFVDQVDWVIGDQIAIGASGFDPNEFQTFEITNIVNPKQPFQVPEQEDEDEDQSQRRLQDNIQSDADYINRSNQRNIGKSGSYRQQLDLNLADNIDTNLITKIYLSSNLEYYHSGTSFQINSKIVDMRTEVALLNRNLKITGEGDWPCSFLNTQFTDYFSFDTPRTLTAHGKLTNVQFSNCGQNDSQNEAVRVHNLGANNQQSPGLTVSNSVINYSMTWAVHTENSKNFFFTNNVIFNPRWRGIVIESLSDSVITGNLIIGVHDRALQANTNNPQGDQDQTIDTKLDLPTGIMSCLNSNSCSNVQIRNNVVIGAPFAGFLSQTTTCSSNTGTFFTDNTAKTTSMGLVMTSKSDKCLELVNFSSYFNEVGVTSYSPGSYKYITGLITAENEIGLAVRNSVTATSDSNAQTTFQFTDNLFIGETYHSYCNLQDCSGDCKKRVGFLTSVSDSFTAAVEMTDKIKMPPYNPRGDAHTLGQATMSKITLKNFFYYESCIENSSYGFQSNYYSSDFTIPQYFSQFDLQNVDQKSIAMMSQPNPSWINQSDCVHWNCTGLLNNLVKDLDGSILGSPGWILPNNPGVANIKICTFMETWIGYKCLQDDTGNYYQVFSMQSLDQDKFDRNFSPINITVHGTGFKSQHQQTPYFRNDMNFYMDHVWDGSYTSQKHLTRFPSLIYSGLYYNVTAAGTYPEVMKLQLLGTLDGNQGIVMTFNLTDPRSIQVRMNGELVTPIEYQVGEGSQCSTKDQHGTNRWFHQSAILQIVLKNQTPLYIERVDTIRLSMRIDMSVDEFFADDGATRFIDRLATLLNIDPWRVRIASATQGSTNLSIYIDEDGSSDDLETINQELTTMAKSGELEEGLEVDILEMSSKIQEADQDEDQDGSETTIELAEEDEEDQDNQSQVGLYLTIIIIGGAVILIFISAIVIYFKCFKKKDLQITRVITITPESMAFQVSDDRDDEIYTSRKNKSSLHTTSRGKDQKKLFKPPLNQSERIIFDE